MTREQSVGAASHASNHWREVDWRLVNRNVRRLQVRIVKAVEEGRWGKVKALQRLLTHSRDGTPLPHGLADLERSIDGTTVRLTTRDWHGTVRVSVVFGVHPRTTINESFEVEIAPVPIVSPPLKSRRSAPPTGRPARR